MEKNASNARKCIYYSRGDFPLIADDVYVTVIETKWKSVQICDELFYNPSKQRKLIKTGYIITELSICVFLYSDIKRIIFFFLKEGNNLSFILVYFSKKNRENNWDNLYTKTKISRLFTCKTETILK